MPQARPVCRRRNDSASISSQPAIDSFRPTSASSFISKTNRVRLNTQSQGKGAFKSGGFRPGIPTTGAETPPPRACHSPPAGMVNVNVKPAPLLVGAGLLTLLAGLGFWSHTQPPQAVVGGDNQTANHEGAVSGQSRSRTPAIPQAVEKAMTRGAEAVPPATTLPPDQTPSPTQTPTASAGTDNQAAAAFEASRRRFLNHTARLSERGPASARESVTAGSPGSFLPSGDQLITVEAAVPVRGSSAPALEIAVTGNFAAAAISPPKAETAPSSALPQTDPMNQQVQTSPIQQTNPADFLPANPPSASAETRSGFTREEELFRTRWGWAAFDDVQRAALETATPSE